MSLVKRLSTLIFLAATIILSSTTVITAHNITKILEGYPDFSQFNSLLSQTKLADEINRRRTITILAVTNARVGELSGKPVDALKRILSNHVVLDYFDESKLNKLKDMKTVLTTLYQASGSANQQQGFLDVVHKKDGTIVFGSAMPGAPIDAQLEGSVASQPYNISVLSISHPIIAPGIDGPLPPVSAPPPKATAPTPANKTDSPADSPTEPADAPAAEVPTASEAPADAPAADAPAADADAHAHARSGAGKQAVSSVSLGFIVALTLSFVAAH